MSEQSDAIILVVSEETGAISFVFDGRMYYDLSPFEITIKLKELLSKGGKKASDADEIGPFPPDTNTVSAAEIFGEEKGE
jgi:diadenylate cyclase